MRSGALRGVACPASSRASSRSSPTPDPARSVAVRISASACWYSGAWRSRDSEWLADARIVAESGHRRARGLQRSTSHEPRRSCRADRRRDRCEDHPQSERLLIVLICAQVDGRDDDLGALVQTGPAVVQRVDRGSGLEMQVASPVNTPQEMGNEFTRIMNV